MQHSFNAGGRWFDFFVVAAAVSVGMGVGGLRDRTSKKLFPILGTAIGGAVLLGAGSGLIWAAMHMH